MKKCLEHGKRRGYMFMGDPGTGKTESIQKLLEQFTDLPVFWVDSSSLSSYTAIHEVFKTLHYFPKSICVLTILMHWTSLPSPTRRLHSSSAWTARTTSWPTTES